MLKEENWSAYDIYSPQNFCLEKEKRNITILEGSFLIPSHWEIEIKKKKHSDCVVYNIQHISFLTYVCIKAKKPFFIFSTLTQSKPLLHYRLTLSD